MDNKYYFVFNGVDSRDMGIEISTFPDITKPSKRVVQTEIKGRNGVLTEDEGTYDNYTIGIECVVRGIERADEIARWLNGKGNLILSTEPNKFYKAFIKNSISISDVIYVLQSFLVQFDVYPLKYSLHPQTDIMELTNSTAFKGKGNVDAEPIITVYGTGDATISINGSDYVLTAIDGFLTINSEIQEVYKLDVNQNSKYDAMDFPKLSYDKNEISWVGDITKLEIQPNWRWL